MTTEFPGMPREGLDFLSGLAKNNEREWFQERKDVFEGRVKAPMIALVEALNAEMASFVPACVTAAAKAIPRMNRDVRFSADKSPYKTEIAAIFPCRGKDKQAASGYYIGISPKRAELIAGAYMPDGPALLALRSHVAKREAEMRSLLAARKLQAAWGDIQGERLVRVPKGFEPEHPAADLLRLKQWYFRAELPKDVVLSPKLLPEIVSRFRAAAPFVLELDRILGSAKR